MNPIKFMKLVVWEWMVDGISRRFSAGCTVRCAVAALTLASGCLAAAQEPDAPAQTNDVTAAELLSQLNALVQAADGAQAEDMAPSNELAATNGLPQASAPASGGDRPNRFIRPDNSNPSQGSSRPQINDRRSRGRRSSNSRPGQPGGNGPARDYSSGSDRTQANAAAGTNNGLVSLDYSAFKMIGDRNIFDPNRYPHQPGQARVVSKPKSIDYVTLVGTMSYEKGTFAFFDGTSSDYKKALKLTDSIAGYKVTNITPNSVKLAAGTNELNLSVGAQLRREEDGPWLLAGQFTPYAAAAASTSTNAVATTTTPGSDTTPVGADSDIIKRLMQKREKE
jgi:hypothetical protein